MTSLTVDTPTLRQVASQARARLRDHPGRPCKDLEDCLSVVYAAAVAETLDWVLGLGPLPSGVDSSAMLTRR